MEIMFQGKPQKLVGKLPDVGDQLPKFKVKNSDNKIVKTADIIGKQTVISVVPDIDSGICSIETKKFNQQADKFKNFNFITISNNTVEQQANWCAAKGVSNIKLLSDVELSFGYETGTYLENMGVLARVIFIIDDSGKIIYRQIVPEIASEPDYEEVLSFVEKLN
ncbi:thiol peroxidase [Apilactobacillus xinyiensis]|uniref:thiol peroxidase n=1 Tax=Apilactobacillus xinyiensis TaxID=2841032 RepID=UPI001C7D135A|nr:thiol peroxidase [Apilactobacillus xinyiensis]MCL0312365.1 thiol peroxidase [Apilactobacillus xinyiensis]MCL0318813.1 thiol peroxidase [Apilactobacillus xinyiensis]MCL0329945.1 thiol peroxidase [Apilactobacillus xinyiensis]